MATDTSPVTREHWLELNSKRKQRQRCADDIEAIKKSCSTTCGKPQLGECQDCYSKVIERIRLRYCASSDQEWFTQRKAFLQKLDGMFSDAKDRRIALKLVDEILESEKEAWYRWVLRTYPEFFAVAARSIDTKELRSMLDDPDRSLKELVAAVWKGLDEPSGWAADVEAFAGKVDAANGDAAVLKQLYLDEFFTDKATGQPYENAKQYREEYLASNSISLNSIVDRIISDYQNDKKSQPQRAEAQSNLEAVQRAKMAYDHKMRDKANRRNEKPPVNERLYNLPSCHVCKSAVDPKDVLSCTICQAEYLMGAEGQWTVYCSQRCFNDGHTRHSEKVHDCEAADQCVQTRDEDVMMGNDDADKPVACQECIVQAKMTLFCSERCAAENLKQHRRDKHGASEAVEYSRSQIEPLPDVLDKVLVKGNPGLKFKPVDDA